MTWDYRIVRYQHDYGKSMPGVKAYHYHIMEVTYDARNKIESMIEHDTLIDSSPEALLDDLKIIVGAFKKPVIDDKGIEISGPLLNSADIV